MNNFNVFWSGSLTLTNSLIYKCISIGENVEACATKECIQEVDSEDIGVNPESGRPEMEKKPRNVVFQEEEDDKAKDPTNDVKTPSTETRGSCLIKYNVSTTPYLQR